jgi:hypothetical protein
MTQTLAVQLAVAGEVPDGRGITVSQAGLWHRNATKSRRADRIVRRYFANLQLLINTASPKWVMGSFECRHRPLVPLVPGRTTSLQALRA